MNHLQAAHLRILESLPRERVRTHEAKLREDYQVARKPIAETLELHEQIMAMRAKGLKNYQIAAALAISRMTVTRHVRGDVKTVQKARQP